MTALLLLHPLGSDGSFWRGVGDLTQGAGGAVLAPDLPGHGRTAPPASATLSSYTDAAEAAAGGEPVVVVGISLGGVVAQDLLGRRPDLVRALVLVDTVAVYEPPLLDTWPVRARTARDEGLLPLADPMAAMWFSPGFRDTRPEVVARTRETFLSMDPEGYARTCEALHDADVRGVLHPAVPTLVVCGDQDVAAFTAAAPELAAQAGTQPRWLHGAQHASVLEQPEEFTALVRSFLTQHDC